MKIILDNIICQCVISGLDSQKADVHKELREYLRVRPHNYGKMLMEMRKRGVKGWDGYTYFYSDKGKFPTGFLPTVVTFLLTLGIKPDIVDKRYNVPEFVDTQFNFTAPEFELAAHQQALIKKTCNYIPNTGVSFPRGIWDAATNSGKTAAAGNLLYNIKHPRAIMLVDDQRLLQQHYNDYLKWFPKINDVGIITSGKSVIGNVLTIAMVRTLYNRLKKSVTVQRDLHDKFNILLVDESHGFGGREAVYVINHINAGMRIAMSGSPFAMADKVTKFRFIGMFGTTLHKVSKRYLMDNGFSMIPEIEIYLNPTIGFALTYDQEMDDFIYQNDARADLIADIVCKYRKRKVLISFYMQAHGQLMYDNFCYRYPDLADKAALAHGGMDDRDTTIQAYKNSEVQYLFASTILQQGHNIPGIQVIIYAIGEMATIPQIQFMGRGERLNGDEQYFKFIDIFDQGKFTSKHSRKRIRNYVKEDLPLPIVFKYEARKNGTPK